MIIVIIMTGNQLNGATRHSCLKNEVSVNTWFSAHYRTLQINNCSKSSFVIKVTIMKNTDNFHCKRKPSHAHTMFDYQQR